MADKPREHKIEKSPFLLRDILLALLLLALGLSAFFIIRTQSDAGSVAVVYRDGVRIETYSLRQNGSYDINGGTHTLVIENGEAYVKNADCKNHLCEKRGSVKHVGESIVCLPNRVEVRIEGHADVDLVSD